MPINPNLPLSQINAYSHNTLLEQLGIEVTGITEKSITGTMPVDKRTHQPAGLLHGGASAALIESLASIGSSLIVDMNKFAIVGVEVNANHIRGVRTGIVTGTAEIVHEGKKTHVWQVNIHNEHQQLACTGRLTVVIIDKT